METEVNISGSACIFAALLCLVLPIRWIMAVVMAALFHELCHIFAVYCVGEGVRSIKVTQKGAVIETTPMKPFQELICILSGPVGSLSLFLLHHIFPRLTVCGIIQGVFNLLPIYPLDGGRALACILGMHFSVQTTQKICDAVKYMFMIILLLAGLWAAYPIGLGFIPLLMSLYLVSGVKK